MDNASSLSTCRLLESGSGADCVVIFLLCCCAAEKISSAPLIGCGKMAVEGGC